MQLRQKASLMYWGMSPSSTIRGNNENMSHNFSGFGMAHILEYDTNKKSNKLVRGSWLATLT